MSCSKKWYTSLREIQKVEEGWEGKPKGLFQVLGERGFKK
jgi:hypothetical protein